MWGIVRYTKHKTMHSGGRAMALEAGKLMHECFSAVRLYQLGYAQGMMDHMHVAGNKLFSKARWDTMLASAKGGGDTRSQQRNMALECLATGNYVEDPDDKKRTYLNMESSLAYYVDRWDNARYPVWIRNANDCNSDVGIEIGFDVVIHVYDAESVYDKTFRLVGRIDGLHVERNGDLVAQENKTSGRLDRAWRESYHMSHQVTGYNVAAGVFANTIVDRGLVIGLTLPLPRSITDGIAYVPTIRPQFMKDQWLKWVLHTIDLHDTYIDDPMSAPKYTHSCNRYFRPCSFIPLCASDPEDRKLIYNDMPSDEWSPLHEQATGD